MTGSSGLSRKRFLLIPTFLFILLLFRPQSTAAQAKSFQWERFDVDITVLENGDLRIVETQVLNFAGAPFTFGYRTIYTGDQGQNNGIRNMSVSEGNTVYTQSSSHAPYTFEISESGSEATINWYFEPAIGRRTYTFSYLVEGAIRVGTLEEGDGDQIFWKVIPSDHPATILDSTTTIKLPEGVRPQIYTDTGNYLVAGYVDDQETEEVRIRVSDDGRTIRYEITEGLAAGQELAVRVQFPHGILDIATPNWQNAQQRRHVGNLVVLALSILGLITGPLAVLAIWYTRGRDPELGIVVPEYLTEPPSNLPPAIAGTLIDEKADMSDIISTLVDLAHRGYLTITEKKRDHIFIRSEKADSDLRPFERQFLKDVFRGKETRSLKALRYKFSSKLPKLRKMLYEELVSEGLVPSSPDAVRNQYGCVSAVLLIAAAVGLFAFPIVLGQFASTIICIPMVLGVIGAVALYASRHMPVKTEKGTVAAAQWEAFKEYLKRIDNYENLAEAGALFDKYLPYATAFGLERSWIRQFAKIESTPTPGWYLPHPYYGTGHGGGQLSGSGGLGGSTPSLEGMAGGLGGGLESMSKGLSRMLTSTSTVLQSTRSTSSSGSSGSFSGGFSGGGGFSSGGGGSAGFG